MKPEEPSISSSATDAQEQIKNIKNEIESITKNIIDFKSSLESMIETCEAFQDCSLYHQILKVSLTNDIAEIVFDKDQEL